MSPVGPMLGRRRFRGEGLAGPTPLPAQYAEVNAFHNVCDAGDGVAVHLFQLRRLHEADQLRWHLRTMGPQMPQVELAQP